MDFPRDPDAAGLDLAVELCVRDCRERVRQLPERVRRHAIAQIVAQLESDSRALPGPGDGATP